MDATHRYFKNPVFFSAVALAFLAAPGRAQTPAFTLSTNTVSLNQSVHGGSVTVTSTGDPIIYGASISYAGDNAATNNNWLAIVGGQTGTTPSTIRFS